MLSPPFLSVGKITLTVQRRTAGARVNGRWAEDAAPTSHTIEANVQPGLKWNDVQHLPEGERGRKTIRVWTTFELRARKAGAGGYDSDKFTYDGELYEVMYVLPAYKMGVLNHQKAIACRVETT